MLSSYSAAFLVAAGSFVLLPSSLAQTPRAASCLPASLDCPAELAFVSSFAPWGCPSGGIPNGVIRKPFTTIEACTKQCSGTKWLTIHPDNAASGCECWPENSVPDGMGWSKCGTSGFATYINLHTHDPVNTCALDSMWDCPTPIGELSQGFEPLGCYAGGVGGTTTNNIGSLAACAALCAPTATDLIFRAGEQSCECIPAGRAVWTPTTCDAGNNVYRQATVPHPATSALPAASSSASASSTSESMSAASTSVSSAPVADPTPIRAASCLPASLDCPAELAFVSSFAPWGCPSGGIPNGVIRKPFTTIEACTKQCSGTKWLTIHPDNAASGCECWPENSVPDGMGWSKCGTSGFATYINLHTHDPVNTCALDSMWDCPTPIGELSQGFEPLGCYAGGVGGTTTNNIGSLAACAALCAPTATDLIFRAGEQSCECIPAGRAVWTPTTCDAGNNVYRQATVPHPATSALPAASSSASASSTSESMSAASTSVSSTASIPQISGSQASSAASESATTSVSVSLAVSASVSSAASASQASAVASQSLDTSSSASPTVSASATTASDAPLPLATAVLPACSTPGQGSCPPKPADPRFEPVGCFGAEAVAFQLATLAAGTALGDYLNREACAAFCARSPYAAFIEQPAATQSSCSCFPDSPLLASAPLVSCSLAIQRRAAANVVELLSNPSAVAVAPPTASQAVKMRMRRERQSAEEHIQQHHAFCPEGLTPCTDPSSGGYECLDVANELASCGGCMHGRYDGIDEPKGEDCTMMLGAPDTAVECANSRCVAHVCQAGWLLNRGRCIPSKRSFRSWK